MEPFRNLEIPAYIGCGVSLSAPLEGLPPKSYSPSSRLDEPAGYPAWRGATLAYPRTGLLNCRVPKPFLLRKLTIYQSMTEGTVSRIRALRIP